MPGRPYILAETNWKAVKETDYDVAILPWGATEAHNYHLPYSTDVIQCDSICGEAARLSWEQGAKVILLPTVPFGVNTGQLDVKLDINMNPSTQLAVLRDVTESLSNQGIRKLVVVNGHGGNDFRQMIRELLPKTDVFLCTMHWWQTVDRSEFFEDPGDHADEMETSLIMHFEPDWVLPLTEAGDGRERAFRIEGFRRGWAWTQRDWLKATVDTGVGDPSRATADKGKRFAEVAAERMSTFLIDLAAADLEDLYED